MNFAKYAALGHQSLDQLFANEDPQQFMNNISPLTSPEQNRVFNYWWLAHLIDARIDGYLRTQDHYYSDAAFGTYHYSKHHNYDTLIHEYYDDMLWNGLAALRLYEISGDLEALEDAKAVCEDIDCELPIN